MFKTTAKLSLAALSATFVALVTGNSAQAATFRAASWTDEITGINQKLGAGQSYNYTHDITDNGFDGFPHDIVTSYKLGVQLADDRDRSREFAFIDVPGILGDRTYEVDAGTYFGGISFSALFQLNATGMLDVSVKSKRGDFLVLGSHLVAHGKEKVQSVPEPSSLLSLAIIGAVGANSLVKRQKSQLAG